MRRALLSSLFSFVFLAGCTVKGGDGGGDARRSPTASGPAETTACSSAISYSGGVTVTGAAQYVRRKVTVGGFNEGLGSADPSHATRPAEVRPIRGAEVRVLDGAGNVAQCAQTDSSGNISFVLPNSNATYTIYVNSRSFAFGGNTYLNASVLNRPEENKFYSITTTINPASSTSFGTMTADAYSSGAILGAPFNILDMLYEANVYLRSQVQTCSSTFSGCQNVSLSTAVPKVSAYWEKGFNPNDYFGSSSGLSFYLPGYSRLFILGGINGDVDSSDTDHFDNSVIIHEYGHFLEDSMSKSDSPGGSHNGNKVIDPRLAWSEGWGNFFQAAVLNTPGTAVPRYIDTSGNIDGTPDIFFAVNLETNAVSMDIPNYQGEGNFREFSVTRMLWDVVDTVTDSDHSATDNVSGAFNEIWAAFTKSSKGYNDTNYAFRNIGLLHYSQQLLSGATNWSAPRTVNYHDGNTGRYATYVTTSGTCTPLTTGMAYSIDPSAGSGTSLFNQNRYLHVKLAAGTHTIALRYKTLSGSVKADLDLVVYAEDHTLGTTTGLKGASDASPDNNVATNGTESLTTSYAAGNYLININAYVGVEDGTGINRKSATTTEFSVSLDGSDLCPASL